MPLHLGGLVGAAEPALDARVGAAAGDVPGSTAERSPVREADQRIVGVVQRVTTTSPTSPVATGSPVPGRTISTQHVFVEHQALARRRSRRRRCRGRRSRTPAGRRCRARRGRRAGSAGSLPRHQRLLETARAELVAPFRDVLRTSACRRSPGPQLARSPRPAVRSAPRRRKTVQPRLRTALDIAAGRVSGDRRSSCARGRRGESPPRTARARAPVVRRPALRARRWGRAREHARVRPRSRSPSKPPNGGAGLLQRDQLRLARDRQLGERLAGRDLAGSMPARTPRRRRDRACAICRGSAASSSRSRTRGARVRARRNVAHGLRRRRAAGPSASHRLRRRCASRRGSSCARAVDAEIELLHVLVRARRAPRHPSRRGRSRGCSRSRQSAAPRWCSARRAGSSRPPSGSGRARSRRSPRRSAARGHRRLVEQDHRRPRHQRPAHRVSSAARRPRCSPRGSCVSSSGAGKRGTRAPGPLVLRARSDAHEGAGQQVVLDGEVVEAMPAFHHLHTPNFTS